jgi:large subunit ribosomal protein L21
LIGAVVRDAGSALPLIRSVPWSFVAISHCVLASDLPKICVLPQEVDTVYAVIMNGGKQYRVSEGELVRLEELEVESGAQVEFKDVLLVKTDEKTFVGRPLVAGASVQGTVKENGQGEKVLVFKYKRKKQYKRTRGHRQHYSDVVIEKITVSS